MRGDRRARRVSAAVLVTLAVAALTILVVRIAIGPPSPRRERIAPVAVSERLPVAHRRGGRFCRPPFPSPVAGASVNGALPLVDADTAGALATWLPAFQDTPCRAIRTAIPPGVARRLARAIDRSRPFPSGERSCPSDDAAAVAVYFRLPGTSRVQPVEFALRGCAWMWAPGRAVGEAGIGALAADAPAGWQKYLR